MAPPPPPPPAYKKTLARSLLSLVAIATLMLNTSPDTLVRTASGRQVGSAPHAVPAPQPMCPIPGLDVANLKAAPAPPEVDCYSLGLQRRDKPAVIIDTVLLNNEVEMLLLRMLELEAVVDRLVVVESAVTFTGKPKHLYGEEHQPCFHRWRGKLERMVVEEVPYGLKESGNGPAWAAEAWLRNQLAAAAQQVVDAQRAQARSSGAAVNESWLDEDIILAVSDMDEVPRPHAYAIAKACKGWREPAAFRLDRFFYYSLNWQKPVSWFLGPRLIPWTMRGAVSPQDTRDTSKVPHSPEPYFGQKGGWHMGYFLTVDQIIDKLESFSHTEFNQPPFNTFPWIEGALNYGYDLFGRPGEDLHWSDCLAADADLPEAIKLNWGVFGKHCPLEKDPGPRPR